MNKIKFKTTLSSCEIESEALKDFIGKEVEISILESKQKRGNNRKWAQLGTLALHGSLDNVNLRDYAYE